MKDLPAFALCQIRFNWTIKSIKSKGAEFEVYGTNKVSNFSFRMNERLQSKPEQMLQFSGFNTGAQWHANTPRALVGGAIKRLFSVRESTALHTTLVANQARIVETSGPKRFKKFFASRVSKDDEYFDLVDRWVALPCPKKKLREKTRKKNQERGRFVRDYRKYVDYKTKPGELLAPGKQVRAIGEISDESAFEHGPMASIQKKVFQEDFIYRGCRATFIAGPQPEELDKFIERVVSPIYKIEFLYFSDDSVVVMKTKDGYVRANLDFSASDGSMFKAEFEYAIAVLSCDMSKASHIRRAFKQCQKPVRLINRSSNLANPKDKKSYDFIQVKTKRGQYYLPSGFSGTTLMNNFSEILFFCAMADLANRRTVTKATFEEFIHDSAFNAGYIIKVDHCSSIEDVQFLKHSWGKTKSGEYKPYVNLGCWLRGWGHISGTIEPSKSMSLKDKCDMFAREILKSRENWGTHILSAAFSKAYKPADRITQTKLLQSEIKRTGIVSHNIDVDSLLARYKLNLSDLHSFCDLLQSELRFGVHIHHPVVQAIMAKDYGYCSEGFVTENWRYT